MALRHTYLSMKKKLPEGAEAVLVMRGRGNDELAPSRKLLEDFNAAKEECAQSEMDPVRVYQCAWRASDYEERFREEIRNNPRSMKRLRQLTEASRDKDIFFICYEGEDKPCHRRLLLSIAKEELGALVNASPLQPPAGSENTVPANQPGLFDEPTV